MWACRRPLLLLTLYSTTLFVQLHHTTCLDAIFLFYSTTSATTTTTTFIPPFPSSAILLSGTWTMIMVFIFWIQLYIIYFLFLLGYVFSIYFLINMSHHDGGIRVIHLNCQSWHSIQLPIARCGGTNLVLPSARIYPRNKSMECDSAAGRWHQHTYTQTSGLMSRAERFKRAITKALVWVRERRSTGSNDWRLLIEFGMVQVLPLYC